MNRRELLRLFGWTALVLALPDAVSGEEREIAERVADSLLPDWDLPYLYAVTIESNADFSRPAQAGVRRVGGGDLIIWGLNTFNCLLHWQCRVHTGDMIAVPDAHPIELWTSDPVVRAYALLRVPGQERFRVLSSVHE